MINLYNKSKYDTRMCTYGGISIDIPNNSSISLDEDYDRVKSYYKAFESVGIFCSNVSDVDLALNDDTSSEVINFSNNLSSEDSIVLVPSEFDSSDETTEVSVLESGTFTSDRRFYEKLNKAKLLEISVQLGTDYVDTMSRKELIDLIMKAVKNENR